MPEKRREDLLLRLQGKSLDHLAPSRYEYKCLVLPVCQIFP